MPPCGPDAGDAEIESWEAALASAAARVVTARTRGGKTLEARFQEVLSALTEDGRLYGLGRVSKRSLDHRPRTEAKKVEESYRQRYNETRTRDRLMGFTVDGPHRHDLSLRTDGRGIRDVLSTGQIKVVAAALKLATLAQIEKERRGKLSGDQSTMWMPSWTLQLWLASIELSRKQTGSFFSPVRVRK